MSEVDTLLRKVGLEKYRETLAQHGLFTLEDLREGKGVLQLALPLGPKARLLKELNATEGEETLGTDEYSTLIYALRPYANSLTTLVNRLQEVGKRTPGGVAGRHYVIASTTLKLCEKAIKDSQRYQALSKRGSINVQADLTSCKIAVGSSVRQLRQQQKQGILKSLEDADPSWTLPVLDLSSVTIGQVFSPPKKAQPSRRQSRDAAALDAYLMGQIRSLKQPPEIVVTTILMMLRLFGYEETSWPAAKARLGSHAFLTELPKFNPSEVPDTVLSVVGDYCTDPDTSPELVKLASTEASFVSEWVRKTYTLCTTTRAMNGNGTHEADKVAAAPLPSPIISPTRFDAAQAFATPSPKRDVEHIEHTRQDSEPLAAVVNEKQKAKEEWLQKEEERLGALERRLVQREGLVDTAMERIKDMADAAAKVPLTATTPPPPPAASVAPSPAPTVDISLISSQIQGMQQALQTSVAQRLDADLRARINSLLVAASTSNALLAHILTKKTAKPVIDDEEEEEETPKTTKTPFPGPVAVGTHVEVRQAKPGYVLSHGRGRVGVKLASGEELGALPANLRLVEEEMRDLSKEYPVGIQVRVGGSSGKVTGHSRGRIGVELRSGKKVGTVPEKLHIMSEDDIAKEGFPVGLDVIVMQEATITGTSRGRLGVILANGTKKGVVPEEIMKHPVDEGLSSLFPNGTDVILKDTGKPFKVTGLARGRVGLQSPDGTPASALPFQINRADSTEGLLLEYPIGLSVILKQAHGTVVNHKRGRVGVEMADGSVIGAVPSMLREAELSDKDLKEKYEVGLHVAVGRQRGTIVGAGRMRVGVELRDGSKIGAMPANITLLNDDEVNREFFPVGLEVVVSQEATVTGTSRGRIGVKLADNTAKGVVPEEITKCDSLAQTYPPGTEIVVKSTNKAGTVTGVSRGRIGATVDGKPIGLLPDQLMRKDSQEGLLLDYPIGSTVRIKTARGQVVSHKRGRIGVELDSNGETLGALPFNVRAVELHDAEMKEKYSVGLPVEVGQRQAVVTGAGRGRIGIEFADGTKAGVTPEKVRIISESEQLAEQYPIDTAVEVTSVVEGTVVGISRGRYGVILADGTKIGCMPEQLRPKPLAPMEALPVGASVDVTLKAKVTGHNRGRVGIELSNGGAKLGVLADALRKTDAPEDFPVGTFVIHDGRLGQVTGHSRGRIGVAFENGDTIGVVPMVLKKAPKKQVAAASLRSLQGPPSGKITDVVDRALEEHRYLVSNVYSLLNDNS